MQNSLTNKHLGHLSLVFKYNQLSNEATFEFSYFTYGLATFKQLSYKNKHIL